MKSSGIIIIGGGGHARVLLDVLQVSGHKVLGVCDPNLPVGKHPIFNVEVLGGDDVLEKFDSDFIRLANGIGSIKPATTRREIELSLQKKGFSFLTITHPQAVVAVNTELMEGAQIMAGAVVQSGAHIGKGSIINTRASVDHDCKIGAFNHLAPGVTLSGGVNTGENVHIGTGACVIENIEIGSGSFIGAGAVVIENVPAGAIIRAPLSGTRK